MDFSGVHRNSIDQEMKKVCGTGYKNTVLKERTEQGEGFGHVSDIVGDVSEDTAVFDVELVDNSHDFGCHHVWSNSSGTDPAIEI